MSGLRPEHGASICVETCPGCAAHLSDTWDGEECSRCGFRYVHERVRRRVVHADHQSTDFSVARRVGSQFAAVLSLILAVFAGTTVSNASESMFRETPNGLLIIEGGGFPPEFWWGTGMFGLAIVLLIAAMYATSRGVAWDGGDGR